jgi:uncharacterized Zn-finger protein
MINQNLPSIHELSPPNFRNLQLPPIRIKQPVTKKEYQCKHCYKSYKLKNTLTRHMKNHAGIKPYKCEICNKRFIRRDVLNCHQGTIMCITARLAASNDLIMQAKVKTQQIIRNKLLNSKIYNM